MKFATVSTLRATTQPAIVVDDRVHTLPYPDMLAVIAAGAGAASQKAAKESLALDEVKFLSPIHPKTLRDAYAFETHVKTANRNRGQDVPENWYKFPVFYFSNPTNDFGHDDVIPHPAYTNAIDFELEIAVIIGKAGRRRRRAARAPCTRRSRHCGSRRASPRPRAARRRAASRPRARR